MILQVEKRRFRRKGKLRETRSYYLRYRLDEMPTDRWRSLHCTDKQAADKLARDFLEQLQREQAGILEPKLVRDSAKTPLKEHFEAYLADMAGRGRDGRNGRGAFLLSSRVEKLLSECGWKASADITADSFVAWRARNDLAPKTANHYLQAVRGWLNWMVEVGRIKANPLRNVRKAEERGGKVRVRRAFSDDELRRLVAGSGPRGIIYFTAARTGLRSDELRQLTWGDVTLDGGAPRFLVREHVAKSRREESVPLVSEVVEELRAYRPPHPSPADPVFPNGIPRASRLKVDCERNGIAYRDASGRYADFHSLRYTFATFLARSGVSPRLTMKLMRHRDPATTAKVYTDDTLLMAEQVVKGLPALGGCTHGYAQISVGTGQNLSVPVAPMPRAGDTENPGKIGENRGFRGHPEEEKLERAKGFEPSTFTLAR